MGQKSKVAIIGGTGFQLGKSWQETASIECNTPYGNPSAPLSIGQLNTTKLIVLHRHGLQHTIAPHEINYRANIWALKEQGVSTIIALAAVGSTQKKLNPGTLIVPNQLIDYTYGRAHTFYQQRNTTLDAFVNVHHIDFTEPFEASVRKALLGSAKHENIGVEDGGVYGCTQGPRLETAAEIKRLAQDGCDIVGMTAMPEAALARELEIKYATIALVVNYAAGVGEAVNLDKVHHISEQGMKKIQSILVSATKQLSSAA